MSKLKLMSYVLVLSAVALSQPAMAKEYLVTLDCEDPAVVDGATCQAIARKGNQVVSSNVLACDAFTTFDATTFETNFNPTKVVLNQVYASLFAPGNRRMKCNYNATATGGVVEEGEAECVLPNQNDRQSECEVTDDF